MRALPSSYGSHMITTTTVLDPLVVRPRRGALLYESDSTAGPRRNQRDAPTPTPTGRVTRARAIRSDHDAKLAARCDTSQRRAPHTSTGPTLTADQHFRATGKHQGHISNFSPTPPLPPHLPPRHNPRPRKKIWRRDRDSNPRTGLTVSGFQNHRSGVEITGSTYPIVSKP